MMSIKRALSGMKGWNVIFELDGGLYAMSNVSPEEPVHFSMNPTTFLRHGYFEDAAQLDAEIIRRARDTLSQYLQDKERLKACPLLGDKRTMRSLLGLNDEGGNV